MAFFEFPQFEATTIFRWALRLVLILFLAWLVRRNPAEDETEDDNSKGKRPTRDFSSLKNSGGHRAGGGRGQGSARFPMTNPQQRQQGRDAYSASSNGVRERLKSGGLSNPGSFDFDSVIDKVSKPRDMWEVRKSGEGPASRRLATSVITTSAAGSMERSAPDPEGSLSSLTSLLNATSNSHKPKIQPPSLSTRKAREEEAARTLHGHERPVTHITWNRDCNLLFTCAKDKTVCVWTFPEGEQLGVYRGHSGAVWSCSVTGDSRWLVSSGADRLVIVWEARTSRELTRVELPGVARCVEWAGCKAPSRGEEETVSERFVTCHNKFGSHPAAIGVWRFDGETIEGLLRIDTLPTPANQVKWGRDDTVLASAHDNGELIFWNADTGVEERRLQAHSAAIQKLDFTLDREVVATASLDKSVKVWDLSAGDDITLLYQATTDRPLNAVALGPISRERAVGAPGSRAAGVSVIAAGGQDVREVAKSSGDSEQFGTLMFRLGIEEQLPGELRADGVTKGHFGPVHTLAFARDGSAIASGSEDGCIRLHTIDASNVTASLASSAGS